jgi:hypothetical protein
MRTIDKKKFYKLIPDGGNGVSEELAYFLENCDVPEDIFADCDSLEELNRQAKELCEN